MQLPRRSGQALVEVIVAMGILVIMASAFTRLSISSYDGGRQSREQTVATHFAKEGLEAARSIAQRDFTALTIGTHGLEDDSGYYTLSGSTNTMEKYNRSLVLTTVSRDGNGNIVTTGGSVDTDTIGARSTVTWNLQQGRPQTVSLFTYLTNWNLTQWVTDLLADFNLMFMNSTQTSQVDDGEVSLRTIGSLGSPVAWTSVPLSGRNITEVHVHRARDRLYASTTNTASEEFYSYDISNVEDGVVTLSGAVSIGARADGFALTSTHAFVINRSNTSEVRVVDLEDMSIAAAWNLDSNANPNDIVIDEDADRAYVVTNDSSVGPTESSEFYILDISNPTAGSPTIVGESELGEDMNGVAIGHGFAYTVGNTNNRELRMIDLSSPSTITNCNLPGNQDANEVYVEGNSLFIGRDGGGQPEFIEYAIDPNDPSDCSYITSNVNGSTQLGSDDILAMSVNTEEGYVFVTTSDSGGDIRVISLSDFSDTLYNATGSLCDGITFLGRFVYGGCRNDSQAIQILEGGAGAGSDEDIFTDSLQNSWTLSDNGGNDSDADADADNDILARTGTESMWINPDASGHTQWNKNYSTTSSGSVEFYINSLSPWAFAVYDSNGASPHGTTSVTNATYGSDFETNADEDGLTDFPTADFAAMKALAQSTSSYINAGGSNLTLDAADIASYAGKLVFVEFTKSNRDLTLNFENLGGSYSVSFATIGGRHINLQNYGGVTLSPAMSNYPTIAHDGGSHIRFRTNADMTVNGLLFSQNGEVHSSPLNGGNRITLNGSAIADKIDGSFERVNVTYTNDFHTSPTLFMSPSYSGQTLQVGADIGTPVNTSSYVTLDNDISTWQQVSIPYTDLGIPSSSISYIRLTDLTATDQPTVFFDDVKLTSVSSSAELSRYGTFTSTPFDSESTSTTWDEINWSRGTGTGTLVFRLRTASSLTNLKTATWVGSDGTEDTVYASTGATITTDPGATGTRYIQWKGYFSGSGSNTPVLEDITLSFQ